MSIKIDPNRQPGGPDSAKRLETPRQAERSERATTSKPEGKSDRVEVSKDAQLLTSALKVATSTPEVRADAVERARQALEDGRIGQDSTTLAERIIDDLLKGV
jgi:flagellar biosynthesis anti-sigma factor FlgM